jgi:DNA-binding NarL/FixJ family response regulator
VVTAETDACTHYEGREPGGAVRLLVVDDHPFVRESLSDLLDDEADLTVVGECADGSEVVEAAVRLRPDVVLMDVSMPVMDGFTATAALKAAQPDAKVLVLTSHGISLRQRALDAGAHGFVEKSAATDTLLRCIRAVAVGCQCCL